MNKMAVTERYNLPYPTLNDSANVPEDIKKLAQKLEEVLPDVTGNEIVISPEEPTKEDAKLWINPEEPLNNIGTEVIDYSINEVKTGSTWIDGKSIYRKVIDIGYLPNKDYNEISSELTNINIIKMEGIAVRETDNLAITLPYSAEDYLTTIMYISTSNKIRILSQNDMSAYKGYVILEYTKNMEAINEI